MIVRDKEIIMAEMEEAAVRLGMTSISLPTAILPTLKAFSSLQTGGDAIGCQRDTPVSAEYW